MMNQLLLSNRNSTKQITTILRKQEEVKQNYIVFIFHQHSEFNISLDVEVIQSNIPENIAEVLKQQVMYD
jgi:hypothetical protein